MSKYYGIYRQLKDGRLSRRPIRCYEAANEEEAMDAFVSQGVYPEKFEFVCRELEDTTDKNIMRNMANAEEVIMQNKKIRG